jgi:hypothetical protein
MPIERPFLYETQEGKRSFQEKRQESLYHTFKANANKTIGLQRPGGLVRSDYLLEFFGIKTPVTNGTLGINSGRKRIVG